MHVLGILLVPHMKRILYQFGRLHGMDPELKETTW